ncbi:DinB family protein [Micromonospora sp. CPCC 206061]|uniref:DinB family protein n=1 Tax=Micromonospora sp. CPCC 206061 TaxID=3122410 RepID=UPI002FEEC6BC
MAAEPLLVLSLDEARQQIVADHRLLTELVKDRAEDELTAPYPVDGRPLGDSCESLRDLVAHVLMWDEINLAVIAEMTRGRRHWSQDPWWEEPAIGRLLNAAGVAAGRVLPVELLLSRFDVVHRAMVDELSRHDDEAWQAGLGALVQPAMTVPGQRPYRHAALHLGGFTAAHP